MERAGQPGKLKFCFLELSGTFLFKNISDLKLAEPTYVDLVTTTGQLYFSIVLTFYNCLIFITKDFVTKDFF